MADLKKAGLWVPRAFFFYEASNPHFSTGIHYWPPSFPSLKGNLPGNCFFMRRSLLGELYNRKIDILALKLFSQFHK